MQPKIKELQKKHKGDREKVARETMALYKEHGVNPAAGCLPLIVTIVFFFTLFTVIRNLADKQSFFVDKEILYPFVQATEKINDISAGFFSLGDASPVLGAFTAAATYIQIRMMQGKKKEEEKEEKADEKKGDVPDFATIMQKQMLFIIPAMTLFVGFTFPAGLTLYWFTSTVFTIAQQWFVMKNR